MFSTMSTFLLTAIALTAVSPVEFTAAKPVWLEGRETEMNVYAGFRAVIDDAVSEPATIRVAASTLYRLYVNGEFIGHGPARGPHGYYRVDEWKTLPWRSNGRMWSPLRWRDIMPTVTMLDQPRSCRRKRQAETVLAQPALKQTVHRPIAERMQKVQRHSFQRLRGGMATCSGLDAPAAPGKLSGSSALIRTATAAKQLLPRGVPYSRF